MGKGIWQWLASRNSASPYGHVSHGAEDARFGWLDVVGMDIESGPIADGAILVGRHREDAHLRMCAENRLANSGTPSWLVQCDHKEIGQNLMHAFGNFHVVSYFSDDFYVRLIRKRGKNHLPHEFGLVSHENANQLIHDHFFFQ
jgi:hypothetical protein